MSKLVAGLQLTSVVALERTESSSIERARAEIAQRGRCRRRSAHAVDRHAARHHRADRAGNEIAGRVVVGETGRATSDEVAVERQPRPRAVVVRELDAVAVARAAGLGRAGIADEDQLGIETAATTPTALDCRCGIATVRTPTSAPFARTSGVTAIGGLAGRRDRG